MFGHVVFVEVLDVPSAVLGLVQALKALHFLWWGPTARSDLPLVLQRRETSFPISVGPPSKCPYTHSEKIGRAALVYSPGLPLIVD